MKIYRDLISGDELGSDTYPTEVLHDAVLKIKCKLMTESCDIDESALGGNASADGADDGAGADATSITGVNLVMSHKLIETNMGKKDFQVYLKAYMKDIKKKLDADHPDRVNAFQKGCTAFAKELLKDYKEFQLFMGEKMDPEGALVYVKWDGETPYAYIFKDGIEEEKV